MKLINTIMLATVSLMILSSCGVYTHVAENAKQLDSDQHVEINLKIQVPYYHHGNVGDGRWMTYLTKINNNPTRDHVPAVLFWVLAPGKHIIECKNDHYIKNWINVHYMNTGEHKVMATTHIDKTETYSNSIYLESGKYMHVQICEMVRENAEIKIQHFAKPAYSLP